MAIASVVTTNLVLTGDLSLTESFATASNASSPAQFDDITLAMGANTITVPAISGVTVPVGVIIVPPAANTQLITLKGVSGDTGIPLHKTNRSDIALDTTSTTFVLNAAAQIKGVRLYWY